MSIVTRTGDDGSTGLMYNRRVSKSAPRVEAYGTLDELNAALGMARALSPHPFVQETLLAIQKDLVLVMGELATLPSDLPRYRQDGFQVTDPAFIERLEAVIRRVEAEGVSYKGWATPGGNVPAAAIDCARTACREAELGLLGVLEVGLLNPRRADLILQSLNRLSDVLWLEARRAESAIPAPQA